MAPVDVCVVLSLLCHVTVVPTATVIGFGEKAVVVSVDAPLTMVIAEPLVGDGDVGMGVLLFAQPAIMAVSARAPSNRIDISRSLLRVRRGQKGCRTVRAFAGDLSRLCVRSTYDLPQPGFRGRNPADALQWTRFPENFMSRTIVGIALFAIGIASSAPAFAQTADTARPHAHPDKAPVLAWAAAVTFDQATTYRFSSGYHDLLHEQNVLVRPLDGHPVWLVGAGSAIDAASGWIAWRLLGERHPRIAKFVFYGAAAYRSYLAVWNIEMMRRAQAVRAGMAGVH